MLERGDEARVVLLLLVPPAVFGGEDRADEHLVDRRVELHPREALREFAGIRSEQTREVGILEIANPVGDAEVAQIDDRRDVPAFELRERYVREFPVEFVWSQPRFVHRRTVAQI